MEEGAWRALQYRGTSLIRNRRALQYRGTSRIRNIPTGGELAAGVEAGLGGLLEEGAWRALMVDAFGSQVYFTEMCSGSEAGSYLRLIGGLVFKAQDSQGHILALT